MKLPLAVQAAAGAIDSAAAARDAKRKSMRRFTWVRLPHDFLRRPTWRLVSSMAGAPLALVRLTAIELLVYASGNQPRGCVEGFSVLELAADLALPNPEAVARIYAALEHPDVAWLDQDFIVSFWADNPDAEPTERDRELAKNRQQRARERKKERAAQSYPPSRRDGRDSVTSRTRSDQIREQEGSRKGETGPVVDLSTGTAPADPHRQSGDSGDAPPGVTSVTPELWLKVAGERIVTEQGNVVATRAELLIERWKRDLGPAAVREILEGAVKVGHRGEKLLAFVERELERVRAGEQGPQLPLPPAVVRRQHG